MAYQAALFDMDGLLLDSESVYTDVTQQIVGQWGKTFDWSIKKDMIGRDSRESAELLVERLALPITGADYLRLRDPLLEQGFQSVPALPGAEALIRALSKKSIPIAVATSSTDYFFQLKTAQHDWFSLFDTVVTSSHAQVTRAKPAPDIFLTAAKQLGIDPTSCVVFEDAPAGLEAAKTANMACICVPDPNMDHSAYPNADQILASLDEFDVDRWFG